MSDQDATPDGKKARRKAGKSNHGRHAGKTNRRPVRHPVEKTCCHVGDCENVCRIDLLCIQCKEPTCSDHLFKDVCDACHEENRENMEREEADFSQDMWGE